MARLTFWRLVAVVPVMLVVSFASFALLSMHGVDPAEQLLGPAATERQLEAKRAELGLERPLVERYAAWLADAAHGDLGESLYSSTPVATTLAPRLGVTLSLVIGGLTVAAFVGVPAGVWAALRLGRGGDRVVTTGAAIVQAVPGFWLGTLLLLVFAVRWQLFDAVFYVPPSESIGGWLRSITLPSIALGATGAAWLCRQTRSELATILRQEYITTALAKGASRRQVVFGHALRSAGGRLAGVIAILLTGLLGTSFAIERIFAIPGLGTLALESITRNDPAPLLGVVLCVVALVITAGLVLDLVHGALDPRVRPA